ncbi:MAG TPA: YqeG family HAD IIIA-type phosphatase, partial [Fimbriimonadaceae bacterium]|nr:YqeG family HAD IIIA-type phosphatase [Fimbriimonadaceae bacterium]
MSKFRVGEFDRSRVPSVFRSLTPAHAVESLLQIDLKGLYDRGKRLILLDVDHTIIKWGQEEFPPGIAEWVEEARSLGFNLCILSNTRKKARLARLSAKLGVETVNGKFKPSRVMFRLAMIKFQAKPDETIMIGDQIFTDILGANRSGIEAIWVRKMDGPEFAGTKISRLGELLLRSALYRALVTPVDESADAPEVERSKPLTERTIFRQFLRFCVVGASSFIVDFGVRWLLMFVVPWQGDLLSRALGRWFNDLSPSLFAIQRDASDAAVPVITVIAATLAIMNSFIWNRMWTFEIKGREERMAQLRRFYLVSIVGLLLNTIVTKMFYSIIPGHPKRSLAVATMIAAG